MARPAKTMQQSLENEIRRVVESPYPTQLQTLRDILVKTDDLAIEAWTVRNPDQIDLLAEDVVAALPHWPYCVDIVARLSCVGEARDAFLRAEPALLPSIIDKAIEHLDGDEKYLAAAASILSHPLCEDVPLPASTQILLIKVSERAASRPDVASVNLLNILLKGACRPLIGSFSADTLRRFEANVFKILREASDVDQQSLGLVCLSIMRILLSGMNSSDIRSWTGEAMNVFFTGPKAHKTMQLVVLQMVWSCSPQAPVDIGRSTKNVSTAIDVLEAINGRTRTDWCDKNASIIRKLLEKATAPGLAVELRLHILTFLTLLLPAEHIPTQITQTYEQVLGSIGSMQLRLPDLRLALSQSMRVMKPKLGERSILEMVRAAIAMCMSGVSVMQSASAAQFGVLFRVMLDTNPPLNARQVTGIWAADSVVPDFIRRTTPALVAAGRRPGDGTETHPDLTSTLTELLLQTAVVAAGVGISIPPEIVSKLLHIHSIPLQFGARQVITRPRDTLRSPFFNSSKSPSIDSNLSWQQNLAGVLQTKSADEHRAVVTAVTKICADLERRCVSVEEPLRAERKKHKELQSRYAELDQAYGQLESQLIDQDLNISGIEKEKADLSSHIKAAEVEKTDLLVRVDQAEARLQKAQQSARDEISRLQTRYEQMEVHHASVSARQQDDMEALEERVQELTNNHATAEAATKSEKQRVAEFSSKIQDLTDAQSVLRQDLQDKENNLQRMRQDLQSGEEGSLEYQKRIEEQHKATRRALDDVERLRTAMAEQRQAAAREKEDFIAEYQESAKQAHEEWQSERSSLQQRLLALEEHVEAADASHRETVECLEDKANEQQKKIEKLKRECVRKDNQVAEAQEMRNRLMSAMGLGQAKAQQDAVQSTLPIRSASSASTPGPHQPNTPAKSQFDGASQMDASFSGASSQQEPTPKRTKPRKAFKVPTLNQPREPSSRRPARSVRLSRTVERQPLAETTTNRSPQRNRSPTKVMFKDMKEAPQIDDPDLQVLDGWSFTTDIITSTPGIGLGQDLDDESTLDG